MTLLAIAIYLGYYICLVSVIPQLGACAAVRRHRHCLLALQGLNLSKLIVCTEIWGLLKAPQKPTALHFYLRH